MCDGTPDSNRTTSADLYNGYSGIKAFNCDDAERLLLEKVFLILPLHTRPHLTVRLDYSTQSNERFDCRLSENLLKDLLFTVA